MAYKQVQSSSTWTPVLTFGGGSTGITYTTQSATYSVIGNVCFLNVLITLSNKGSSTGTAAITGLGFTPAANSTGVVTYQNTTNAGKEIVALFRNNSGFEMLLRSINTATTLTNLADTDFQNTSQFNITGFFLM